MKLRRFTRLQSLYLLISLVLLLAIGSIALATGDADGGLVSSGLDEHGILHAQHGGVEGHLPASSLNVSLIGKMRINQDFADRIADGTVFGNYAYLAAFNQRNCQKGGVYVFDISNLANPKQINFIRTNNNSYVGEGVHVIHLDTAYFNGDVLVHNNEICGPTRSGAVGGLSIVDVTNPKVHSYLARGVGDFTPVFNTGQSGEPVAHMIHSAFAWDAGDRAYVVMVDDEEAADVDIMDITNPRNPLLIAEFDLGSYFPVIHQPGFSVFSTFLHDMIVKQINGRWIMLLSYWDGGYVVMDVTDPTAPTYIADSDWTIPDPQIMEHFGIAMDPKGNAHEAEFTLDNAYIVAADEEFNPVGIVGENLDDGVQFDAFSGSDTPAPPVNTSLTGPTVFVGRACNSDPAVPPATDPAQIAVVERGLCTFTEKVTNVSAAGGYQAMVVFNREGNDPVNGPCLDSFGMTAAGSIFTFGVLPRDLGLAIFDLPYNAAECEDATLLQAPVTIGTVGDNLSLTATFSGWGYIHLFQNNPGKLVELDTFAVSEAMDPAYVSGFGALSVHEVATSLTQNDLVYVAHYDAGLRVLRIVNDELVEVGHFIDQGGNDFWGVQVFSRNGHEYVLASDRDYGLYIFEYTGP